MEMVNYFRLFESTTDQEEIATLRKRLFDLNQDYQLVYQIYDDGARRQLQNYIENQVKECHERLNKLGVTLLDE